LWDLLQGEGFSPELFLAPGMPRIRPVLVFLSAHAASLDSNSQLEEGGVEHVALAAELLHAAVLVHDAALGRQGGRRRRMARRLLGAFGWLGGNRLTLRALELARQAPTSEVVGEMVDALREVSEARSIWERWEDRSPSAAEHLCHAEQRTGAVFSFACRAGGRLAGARRPTITGLGRYGYHMGVAWQLKEEVAIFQQPIEACSASLQERAAARRPLYPVSLASEGDDSVPGLWSLLCREEDSSTALSLAESVRSSEVLTIASQRVQQSVWSARKALADVPPSSYRDSLGDLAQALAK
jgi:octaprenyl-diphosphate synthase